MAWPHLLDVQHYTDAHTCSGPDGGPLGVVRALLGRLLAVGTTAAGSGWSTPISLKTPSSSMIRKGDLQQAGPGIAPRTAWMLYANSWAGWQIGACHGLLQ